MNHPLLPFALQAVALSSRIAREVQQSLEKVRQITKDDRSPVTVADFAVQAVIALELFEDDETTLIVGEEKADVLRQPEQAKVLEAVVEVVRTVWPSITPEEVLGAIDRCDHDATGDSYWALDPIDGTKGFLRSQQYAIALGRIEAGKVTAGVIGCPNLPASHSRPLEVADDTGVMYAAAIGEGAYEVSTEYPDTEPLRVLSADYEAGNSIRVCESVEKGHSKQSDTARIIEALGSSSSPVRLDSQCKYGVVARGQADAYLRLPTSGEYVEKIWDHAAGSVIATEAGAMVTDITGSPLDFTQGRRLEKNRGIICAATSLHGSIIEAIDKLGIGAAV